MSRFFWIAVLTRRWLPSRKQFPRIENAFLVKEGAGWKMDSYLFAG